MPRNKRARKKGGGGGRPPSWAEFKHVGADEHAGIEDAPGEYVENETFREHVRGFLSDPNRKSVKQEFGEGWTNAMRYASYCLGDPKLKDPTIDALINEGKRNTEEVVRGVGHRLGETRTIDGAKKVILGVGRHSAKHAGIVARFVGGGVLKNPDAVPAAKEILIELGKNPDHAKEIARFMVPGLREDDEIEDEAGRRYYRSPKTAEDVLVGIGGHGREQADTIIRFVAPRIGRKDNKAERRVLIKLAGQNIENGESVIRKMSRALGRPSEAEAATEVLIETAKHSPEHAALVSRFVLGGLNGTEARKAIKTVFKGMFKHFKKQDYHEHGVAAILPLKVCMGKDKDPRLRDAAIEVYKDITG